MPSGEQSDKNAVMLKIEEINPFQKDIAKKLYGFLDKIKWLTTTPYYFGALVIVAIPYLADLKNFKFLLAKTWSDFLFGLIFAGLLYIAGVFLLKLVIFNPIRKKKIAKLKAILQKSETHSHLLKKLGEIDPTIARNTKKYLKKEGIEF